ncbi:protein MSF1 [Kluyveromyces marxianus]|uniref:Protein MSF1 n=2 Tax=Kluyveromyces marxianus TaxID=4911 RepID=W0TEH7_KLUMD|nr:protein MSF1 [Kluyveromyces marxianus DMKU3-1042]QGN16922.1 protein MSF1 [Kluyveromyces marxianus]BAO41216.1 protein MSF1 [Kluyveromyces marxianus DMKU3-1042]BAP72665.1 protein MSF1 [Kluyveromyces marxianus]
MRLFENQHVFDYSWEYITAANWKKYPNEVSTHVIAVDVLRRELDSSGKILTSERLITCKQSVPKWVMMLVGGSNVSYIREVSVVNLDKKSLTLRSCNLTGSNLLKVYETVSYVPHPEDPQRRTLFKQEAQITAYATFTKLCNKIEEWSVNRFHENAEKGKKGFDSVLQLLDESWKQTDKIMDDLVEKVDETVVDIKKTTDIIMKETEKKSSLLATYYGYFSEAFKTPTDLNE